MKLELEQARSLLRYALAENFRAWLLEIDGSVPSIELGEHARAIVADHLAERLEDLAARFLSNRRP